MFKIVLENCDSETLFMGFEEPTQKGAIGHYEAIKKAVERFVDWNEVLPLVSSIVTDGASVNVGKKNGLWLIFKQKRNEIGNNFGPLITIWCAVHRSALAWEKLTVEISELNKLIQMCSSISSYFHQSGLSTNELKQIALDENITLYTLPKYFDVRWTEFTSSLLLSVLRNWRILIRYFTIKKSRKRQ